MALAFRAIAFVALVAVTTTIMALPYAGLAPPDGTPSRAAALAASSRAVTANEH